MLKHERLLTIQALVDERGIITVNEIGQALGVSTMTIRRDLDELAANKLLRRIHGGAQRLDSHPKERSHDEKRALNIEAKTYIATLAAAQVAPGDTIFIGPGSTLELMAPHLAKQDVQVITNSLQVFQSFQTQNIGDIQLIGGRYRAKSGAFIGSLANELLERLSLSKAFIGTNGLADNAVTTTSAEEGQTLRLALDHSKEAFVVCDHTKLNHQDFYTFYALDQMTGLITDPKIATNDRQNYGQYVQVITE